MKTCPICNARCFDDMEVCYGCLHRFADAEDTYDFGATVEVMSPEQLPGPISIPQEGTDGFTTEQETLGGYVASNIPKRSNPQSRGRHAAESQSGTSFTAEGRHSPAPMQTQTQIAPPLSNGKTVTSWMPIAVMENNGSVPIVSPGNETGDTAMRYRLVLGIQPI